MNILRTVKKLLAKRAALRAELEKIDSLLAPFEGAASEPKVVAPTKSRSPMTAAAKARISAAAKARWKKAKAAGKSRL